MACDPAGWVRGPSGRLLEAVRVANDADERYREVFSPELRERAEAVFHPNRFKIAGSREYDPAMRQHDASG